MKTFKILVATTNMQWRLADARDGLAIENTFADRDAADEAMDKIKTTAQPVKTPGCLSMKTTLVGGSMWPTYLK